MPTSSKNRGRSHPPSPPPLPLTLSPWSKQVQAPVGQNSPAAPTPPQRQQVSVGSVLQPAQLDVVSQPAAAAASAGRKLGERHTLTPCLHACWQSLVCLTGQVAQEWAAAAAGSAAAYQMPDWRHPAPLLPPVILLAHARLLLPSCRSPWAASWRRLPFEQMGQAAAELEAQQLLLLPLLPALIPERPLAFQVPLHGP
jgi:hypothetical protein